MNSCKIALRDAEEIDTDVEDEGGATEGYALNGRREREMV